MFHTIVNTFTSDTKRKTIDDLKDWVLHRYENDIKSRPSLHTYVKKLPPEIIQRVDELRYSSEIKKDICSQFPDGMCNIIPLQDTDELYISHYNYDNGGDQGLFDKHYDGNLRFINGPTVVRSLIYLSSDDDYVVNFQDSGVKKNFKTYDYGILDFHREYHWVEGSYNPSGTPRILLKCNYLICPGCSTWYTHCIKWVNMAVFYIVKAAMEYSKSPKNPLQRVVGWGCNVARQINNDNAVLTIILFILFSSSALSLIIVLIRTLLTVVYENLMSC